MIRMTWVQFLTVILTIVVPLSGGTFAICKYAKAGEISEYTLRIERLEKRVAELEMRLNLCLKASDRQVSGATTQDEPASDALFVKIVEPSSGDLVDKRTAVRYALGGDVPEGVEVILAIRDPFGQWWSWGKADGETYTDIQIGQDDDGGNTFELRILLTDQPLAVNVPHTSLPQAVASDSVIVVRK